MTDEKHGRPARMGNLFAALIGEAPQVDGDAPAASAADAARSGLDLEALSRSLARSADPLAQLRDFVADVRRRESDADAALPSAFELHLASRLEGAGLAADALKNLKARIVRPRTSDLFYVRVDDEKLPYAAKLAVLGVEAALNSALLTSRLFDDDADAEPEERLLAAEQRVARSITAQAERAALRIEDGPARGEWDLRHAISLGIESFQLPWRLTCRWRVNARAGEAAFAVDLVPPSIWPSTCYVDGLGVVPATPEMRRRAATDYNLRLALLLAGYAFAVGPGVERVWVAGVVDSAAGHACYYSACLTRDLMEGLDLSASPNPLAVLRLAGAELAEDGLGLAPVRQTFSLEDERFCPSERWDAPELSDAALPPEQARALGCTHVRDLGVDEARGRRAASRELTRRLGSSTQKNVRALLDEAEKSPGSAEAAKRCVRLLIEGGLDDDPEAIADAFVAGSDFAADVARAREKLAVGQDPVEAGRIAEESLEPIEAEGRYADSWPVTWRSFEAYTDRALYNRMVGTPGEDVHLVPPAYFEAHMLASVAAITEGDAEKALAHARRAVEIAPVSSQASLQLSNCLEVAGDEDAAVEELRRLLSLAHDPEACGLGYLRMGQLMWQRGDLLAAQACCQSASRHLGAPALVAGLAVVALFGQAAGLGTGGMPKDQAEAALRAARIPIAPTPEVTEAFFESARAATNAEVWPVAHDFLTTLAQMSHDDVYFGMLRSLEDEPDR